MTGISLSIDAILLFFSARNILPLLIRRLLSLDFRSISCPSSSSLSYILYYILVSYFPPQAIFLNPSKRANIQLILVHLPSK